LRSYKATESYKAAFSFTYGLKVGMLINNKVFIGLRYSNLGSYKYEYTTTEAADVLDPQWALYGIGVPSSWGWREAGGSWHEYPKEKNYQNERSDRFN
jgi:hypothetical protein